MTNTEPRFSTLVSAPFARENVTKECFFRAYVPRLLSNTPSNIEYLHVKYLSALVTRTLLLVY